MTAVAEPELISDLPGLMPSPPTIVEAIMRAVREVREVGKTGYNEHDKYHFRGVDDVVDAARQVFARIGIFALPIKTTSAHRDVVSFSGKNMREATLTVTYRFFGPAGDYLDAEVPGEAMDRGDKGTPKAMSVAFRTLLIQVLMLQTTGTGHHPDPDEDSYDRADGTAGAGADRDAARPSRDELISTVTTLSTELGQLMGVGEYEYLEWLVKVNQDAFGVDITKTRTEDGPVEAVDFGKLRTNQLHMAWTNLRKRLNQEKLARERGA